MTPLEERTVKNIVVVSYSYTGTGRRLAQGLCAHTGWALGEIVEVRPGRGPLRCMLDSWLRRRPPVRYQGPPLGSFDIVVLVAPIWMAKLAGPMRSFVADHRHDIDRHAIVTVMGEEGAPNAVAEIGRWLGRPAHLSVAFKSREVEDGSCTTRLAAFARDLEGVLPASQPLHREVWFTQPA